MLYAVGDIHGEWEMLDELLGRIPHQAGDRFVFVGDYVDRGPDARRVVERLLAFSRERECIFLLGNHESMFLDFLGWKGEPTTKGVTQTFRFAGASTAKADTTTAPMDGRPPGAS
jgi:predicted MPP superfamily phosphohydrolase